MPHIDGVFYPRPFRPMTGHLFDVVPPDHPDMGGATTAEHDWYTELVTATTDLLCFVVNTVRRNYQDHQGVSFTPFQVGGMYAIATEISQLLNKDMGPTQVAKQVNRVAKQFGLVTYSRDPQRLHWPMAGPLQRQDAEDIVDDGFWGRWPTTPSPAEVFAAELWAGRPGGQ